MNDILITAERLHRQGDFAGSERLYRDHLQQQPDNARAWWALSHICYQQRRVGESIEYLEQALRIETENPELYFALGGLLSRTGKDLARAIACYRRAISLRPEYSQALLNLGVLYYKLQDYTAAIEILSRIVAIERNNEKALYNLGLALMRVGRSVEADQLFRRACDIAPGNADIRTCMLFNMHNVPGLSNKAIFEEHLRWAAKFALKGLANESAARATASATIRVGYVSPDFRGHSVANFIKPVLGTHNRNVVTCYCYSDVEYPDETTRQLMRMTDHWRDTAVLSDDQLFQLVRKDEIDILVDLAGHTSRNRLRMFSRRPAPVQVTYLGYPDTTGLSVMDYRLTDARADPEGVSGDLHTERLVRLEGGFLCYEPPCEPKIAGEMPASRNGHITFGSFNNLAKINADVVRAWSEILRSVPAAKLILKARGLGDPAGRDTVLSQFRTQGIGEDRIECLGHATGMEQHLQTYNRIDIALDTFPYNGTTTTCEALWMGVPVITFAGDRHASRVGVSILTTVGLTVCIAVGREAYVSQAVRLACERDYVSDLRNGLRERMRGSPLVDARRFCRELERRYRDMVAR